MAKSKANRREKKIKKTTGKKLSTQEETFYGFNPHTAYTSGRSYEPQERSAAAAAPQNPVGGLAQSTATEQYQRDELRRALEDGEQYGTAQDEVAHKRRRLEVQPEPQQRRGPRDTEE